MEEGADFNVRAKVCQVSNSFDGVGNRVNRITGPEPGVLVAATIVLKAGRGVEGGVSRVVA